MGFIQRVFFFYKNYLYVLCLELVNMNSAFSFTVHFVFGCLLYFLRKVFFVRKNIYFSHDTFISLPVTGQDEKTVFFVSLSTAHRLKGLIMNSLGFINLPNCIKDLPIN